MPEFRFIFGEVFKDPIQDHKHEFLENILDTTFKTTKFHFFIFLEGRIQDYEPAFKNIKGFFKKCSRTPPKTIKGYLLRFR